MSKTEVLGRLISCGFEIQEYFEHTNKLYIISRKVKESEYNMQPSYGPLFRMNRVGYNGNMIGVYKFRTMYPYSEYCQEMVVRENKLENGGKIDNDYRVTKWGEFFRKHWIDELPMIFNVLKGELNIVGIRPLSRHYFSLYPAELQQLRIKVKPGLVPPYYADLPENFEKILESEKKYVVQKLRSPVITDVKYFCRAFVNIVFRGARSK
jgi:lipopolysaccharide/colanic/teichoic acid biosynthesis glycosyltransferase